MALKKIFKGRKVATVRPTDFSQTLLAAGDWNYNLMEQIEAELKLKAPIDNAGLTGTTTVKTLVVNSTATFDIPSTVTMNSLVIVMGSLPLADPGNPGQLWNDGGTVKVS